MKQLAALLFLAASPAFAANDETPTILRGTPAPPPPPPAVVEVPVPQPVIVQMPVYTPQPVYYFALPVRRPVAIRHHRFRH